MGVTDGDDDDDAVLLPVTVDDSESEQDADAVSEADAVIVGVFVSVEDGVPPADSDADDEPVPLGVHDADGDVLGVVDSEPVFEPVNDAVGLRVGDDVRVDDRDFDIVAVDVADVVAVGEADGANSVTSRVCTKLEFSVSTPTCEPKALRKLTVAPLERVAYPLRLKNTMRVTLYIAPRSTAHHSFTQLRLATKFPLPASKSIIPSTPIEA